MRFSDALPFLCVARFGVGVLLAVAWRVVVGVSLGLVVVCGCWSVFERCWWLWVGVLVADVCGWVWMVAAGNGSPRVVAGGVGVLG